MFSIIVSKTPLSLLPTTHTIKAFKPFETNLPDNFLDFEIQQSLIVQLHRLCLAPRTKISHIRELFQRICALLHNDCQNLLFSDGCIAPDWVKKHPSIIGAMYSKAWHPDIVANLIRSGRNIDIIEFVIVKGAKVPSEWKDWIVRSIPDLEWVLNKS